MAYRLPTLLIFIFGFTVIGIHWNNHRRRSRLTTSISGGVRWTNLALLY